MTERLFVHRNLNKGRDKHVYSLKSLKTNKVVGHKERFYLKGTSFRVQPGGLARARREKRRNVHAGVVGRLAKVDDQKYDWKRVRYNPFKSKDFQVDEKKIESAEVVRFTPEGVFAGFAKAAGVDISAFKPCCPKARRNLSSCGCGHKKTAADIKEVASVAIFKDGKLLMGERRDNGKWTCPGGHLEAGETPLEGAIREVKEESGIDLTEKQLIYLDSKNVTADKGKKLRIHAYKANLPKDVKTSMTQDPDGEVKRWHWVNYQPFNKTITENMHVPLDRNILFKAIGIGQDHGTKARKFRDFKAGFEKSARLVHDATQKLQDAQAAEKSKKKDKGALRTGAEAGAATSGALTAGGAAKGALTEYVKERKAPTARSIKDFEKGLKPGDILFTRAGKSISPRLEVDIGSKTKEFPFPEKYPLQAGVGSKHYHAALYTGKKKGVFHAAGQGQVGHEKLRDAVQNYDVVAYRPEGATPGEVRQALAHPKRLKGRRYKTEGELAAQGARMLFDPTGGPKACKNVKGRMVCNTVVSTAYPKQFKKEFASIQDMKGTKGMKAVGRYSRVAPAGMTERLLSGIAHPAAKSLKWGLGAGALAALGKKVMGGKKGEPAAPKRAAKA
jgi:ADP-ribose pyrophosphatase YjhB (NUDIX family)